MERPLRVIADKFGDLYKIEVFDIDHGFDLKVMTLNPLFVMAEVGYAYCWNQSREILQLSDVVIHDSLTLWRKPTGIFHFFKRYVPVAHSFKSRGIGTQLLKCVLEQAKEKGYSQIIGRITKDDLAKNSHLPKWYVLMGFSVTPEHTPSTTHAQIMKFL